MMPSSSSSPENEVSRRIELATEERRARAAASVSSCAETRFLMAAPGDRSTASQIQSDHDGASDAARVAALERRRVRCFARPTAARRGRERDRTLMTREATKRAVARDHARDPPAVQRVGQRHAEREHHAEHGGEEPSRRGSRRSARRAARG